MTEEEMEKIAEMISNRIFAKIEADTIAFNEEFVDSLPSNEEQIAELQMLLLHYEKQEDYTRAANVFKQIQCRQVNMFRHRRSDDYGFAIE